MRERVTERDREHGKKEQQLREREGEAFSHMTILIQYSTLMKYFHNMLNNSLSFASASGRSVTVSGVLVLGSMVILCIYK